MINDSVQTFLVTADCGSFTKAAEKLYLSPTAVMKQINALETQIETPLFVRTSHGVTLTEAGKSVYKDATYLLAYAAKIKLRAQEAAEACCYTICVGTSILYPCKPFMDLWYKINDKFPHYKIHIIPFEDNRKGMLGEIAALGEKYDFLVGVCDSERWLERCSFQPLGTYRRCIGVPMGHRLADRKKLELTDLYGETLIMVKRGDSPGNDKVRDMLEREHPQIRIEDAPNVYDLEVFNNCLAEGNLLSMPECWKDVHPSLVAIPVDWGFHIPYGLLYAKQPPEDILTFIRLVKEHLNEIAS